MARQIYFRGQVAPASVNIPQVHGATSVPHVRSEGAEILKGLAGLGRTAAQAYIRWDDKRQQSLIEDAFLKARSEMSRWSAEYQRTNRGADALEAQAAYEQQWGQIVQGVQSAYKDRLSDGAMHYLGRKMELGRLYALDDGARYQAQQTAAWNKNQEDVRLYQMGEDVANDPYNFARHQMNVSEAVSAWERANPGMDSSAYRRRLEQGMAESIFNGMLAREDFDGAERMLNWGMNGTGGQRQSSGVVTGGAGLHGAVTHTGRHRVLAYRESGTEGSQHVSYGLPQTDGVDVGKYSMITKGAQGGSVGEFIRWAGTQGGVGKELHDKMHALVGGNWGALDSRKLWKEKAAAVWKEVAKSDPKAFETLEDNFMQARFDKVISTLRPEVQEAIRNDKTGALYEMAASTINQHATARTILNRNFDADPEAYVRKVYQDRSDPKRFARTSDPSMGARRMKAEIQDVLGILRGQATGQAVAQAGAEQSTANQSGMTGSYGESAPAAQGTGTGAPSGMFDPAKALTMRRQIEAGRDRQEREAAQAASESIARKVMSTAPELQQQVEFEELEKLSPKVRKLAEPLVNSELKFQKDKKDVNDSMGARGLIEQGEKQNMSVLQFMQFVNKSELSHEAKKLAIDIYSGKDAKGNPIKETYQNRLDLFKLKMEIDARPDMTAEEVEARGINLKLTNAQIGSAQAYREKGGKRQGVTASKVDAIWKRLMKKTSTSGMSNDFYEAVTRNVPDGKIPTEEELTKIISNLVMDGAISEGVGDLPFFNSDTLKEAQDAGKQETWLPKLTGDDDRDKIDGFLKKHNIPTTNYNRRLFKKMNMGVPNSLNWERQ